MWGERGIVVGGVGAELGFLVVGLGLGFLDEVAVEFVGGALGYLVVARAVAVGWRPGQKL